MTDRLGIKFTSTVLGADFWLILDREFVPDDGLACYYPEEISLLKNKTVDELKAIQKVKLAFLGAKVVKGDYGHH